MEYGIDLVKISAVIYSFVEQSTSCSKYEALEIVAEVAGVREVSKDRVRAKANKIPSVNIKEQERLDALRKETVNEWCVLDKVPNGAKEFKAYTDLKFMLKSKELTAIYPYRNINNELLGYAVRLEEKEGKGKDVLPVSYCYNESKKKYAWRSKGFTDNEQDLRYKAIYGAEKLKHSESLEIIKDKESPDNQINVNVKIKPVLIVEGEKSANEAQRLLPEYSVISWMGGVHGVSKVNWQHLKGREVVIWPDNDKEGISSADNIKKYIDRVNGHVGLVGVVDTAKLELPNKWDLADEMPEHLNIQKVRNILLEKKTAEMNIDQHQQMTENTSTKTGVDGWNGVLKTMDAMAKMGKVDIDEVHSNKMYKTTLASIGVDSKTEVTPIINIKQAITDLQYKYDELKNNFHDDRLNLDQNMTKEKKYEHELTREAVIMHCAALDIKKGQQLPQTHIDHIRKTANQIASKLGSTRSYDEGAGGEEFYNIIYSEKWWSQLKQKNMQQVDVAKAKLESKNIDEYTHLLNTQHKDYIKRQDPRDKTQLNHVTTKEHESMMEEINKSATYLVDNNIKTEHQILHSYKVNMTPQAVVKSLNDQCTKYHADIIERYLDQINNNKPVTLNHMEFHCPMKYLSHLQEHHLHNKYMPHNYIIVKKVDIRDIK